MAEPVVLRPFDPEESALLAPLVDESVGEGHDFLTRLVDELESGVNRFDKEGEALLGAYRDDALVGVGGVNRDPFTERSDVGRIRRVYVLAAHRGRGVGASLVRALMAAAAPHFAVVTLRSASEDAARLYDRLGFTRVDDWPNVTHVWHPNGGAA